MGQDINQPQHSPTPKNTPGTINDARYRQLVALSPIPMAIHNKGIVMMANKAVADLIGAKRPNDLIGKYVLDYVHPDSRQAVKERIASLVKGERQHTEVLQEKLIRIDGKTIDVEVVSLLVEYEGNPSIQLILHDITTIKQVQRRLERSKVEAETERRRLHDLFMEAPAMIAIVQTPDHIFELANPLYLQATGRTSDIIGKPVAEVFPELQGQGIIKLLDDVYKTGKPYYGNEILMRIHMPKEGKVKDVYFNFVYQPATNNKGEVYGILVHAVDITPMVISRQKIEESESQYRSIFTSTHDAILIFNMTGQLVDANPAALTMHGYEYKEIKKLHGLKLIHPDDHHIFIEISDAISKGQTFHSTGKHQKKDGTPINVEVTGTAIVYRREQHIMAVVRDITERKLAEEERNYANELLQTVTNNASLGLFMMNGKQRCTFMNAAAEKMTGLNFEEVKKIDRPLHEIIHHTHPDGSHYPLKDCPIDRALPQKNREAGESIFVRKDGTFYPVRFTASPIYKDNMPIGTVIEVEDLTEQLKTQSAYVAVSERREELEKINIALTEQQNQLIALNRSKDEFISLASHQLRTPATGVKQYVAMALDGYAGELNPDLRKFLERAYESNERQLTIVNDLLKVAQVDAGRIRLQRENIDLVQLIDSIMRDNTSRFEERNQKIILKYTDQPICIQADVSHLRMAIENIIDNACKYTDSDKTIQVTVAKLKGKVRIKVKDQGVGMKQEDTEKIFQKFTRLDNSLSTEVGGTGLGLYWTEKIVDLHGGRIDVTSEINKGTTFTIQLPS